MATLTEISFYTRKALVWFVGIFVLYIILRMAVNAGVSYYRASHPPKLAPPNVLFGKLALPKFPKNVSTSGLNFILENIEGRPPETTSSAKVYTMPKKLQSLLTPQKAREFAAQLSFTGEPQVLSSTSYRFIDSKDNLRSLTLDIINLNFELTYDYARDLSVFEKSGLSTPERIIEETQGYLQSKGLVNSSIFTIPPKVTYLKYNSTNLQFSEVKKAADADSVRIDFFRKNVEEYRLLTPNFNTSYIYAIISSSNDANKKYIKVSYIFWPIDFNNFATYPLKSSQTAWEDLVSGKGIVATMGSNNTSSKIIIRKIYLAYYDSGEVENYLQPIFVFEGDGDFVGYVPAIDPSFLE